MYETSVYDHSKIHTYPSIFLEAVLDFFTLRAPNKIMAFRRSRDTKEQVVKKDQTPEVTESPLVIEATPRSQDEVTEAFNLMSGAGCQYEFCCEMERLIASKAVYLVPQIQASLLECRQGWNGDEDHGIFLDILDCYVMYMQDIAQEVAQLVREYKLRAKTLLTKAPAKSKPRIQREKQLEEELMLWLVAQGVTVERQVSTSHKHRLDLWIPGKLFLELKAGQVTGDDVCQAIDYYSTYKIPIYLTGKGLSRGAGRGLEGFNTALGADALVFVSWGAIKPCLHSVLGLQK